MVSELSSFQYINFNLQLSIYQSRLTSLKISYIYIHDSSSLIGLSKVYNKLFLMEFFSSLSIYESTETMGILGKEKSGYYNHSVLSNAEAWLWIGPSESGYFARLLLLLSSKNCFVCLFVFKVSPDLISCILFINSCKCVIYSKKTISFAISNRTTHHLVVSDFS